MRTELKQEISLIKARVITKGTKVAEFISRHQREYKLITGALIGGIMVDSILEPDIVLAAPRVNLQDGGAPVTEPVDFPTGLVCGGVATVIAIAAYFNRDRTGGDNRYQVSDKKTSSWGSGRIANAESAHGNQESDPPSRLSTSSSFDINSARLSPDGAGIEAHEALKRAEYALWIYQQKLKNVDKEVENLVPTLSKMATPLKPSKKDLTHNYQTHIATQKNLIKLNKAILKAIHKKYHDPRFEPKPYEPIMPEYLNKFEYLKNVLSKSNLDPEMRTKLLDEAIELSRLLVRVSNNAKYFYP